MTRAAEAEAERGHGGVSAPLRAGARDQALRALQASGLRLRASGGEAAGAGAGHRVVAAQPPAQCQACAPAVWSRVTVAHLLGPWCVPPPPAPPPWCSHRHPNTGRGMRFQPEPQNPRPTSPIQNIPRPLAPALQGAPGSLYSPWWAFLMPTLSAPEPWHPVFPLHCIFRPPLSSCCVPGALNSAYYILGRLCKFW